MMGLEGKYEAFVGPLLAGLLEGERGRVDGRLLQLLPSCRFHPRTLVHLRIDYHLCRKQIFSVSSKCVRYTMMKWGIWTQNLAFESCAGDFIIDWYNKPVHHVTQIIHSTLFAWVWVEWWLDCLQFPNSFSLPEILLVEEFIWSAF